MGGNEVFGNEERQECLEVLETGVLMRYNFDVERKGIFKVRSFESEFAKYHGADYALGVTSGSTALKVALTALDIAPGDEVIVPAFTFIATYEAVLDVGAIPIMADIDESLNLDPKDIANKMTPHTKAVIPVHMCGAGANIEEIVAQAKRLQLLVLEDNAQSLGGSYKGKKLGSFGEMATFSFDYYKTITTGEGGMVITSSKTLYERSDWYHDHGHDHDHTVSRAMEGRTILGFNYRMNELQGALGLAQFCKLDYIIGEQRKNKKAIKDILAAVKGIGFRKHFDEDGDTATFLAFNFESAAKAMAFQKSFGENGVDVVCFKNSKWHYCPNWEHLLSWSTANSRRFPFTSNDYRGKVEYSIRHIPQAENLMGRTLMMGIPVKMSVERMRQIEKAVEKAKGVL